MGKSNKNLILIPLLEMPLHWSNAFNDIDVWLSLDEAETIMKQLGAGSYAWAEPSDYRSSEIVLAFLNRNMALAQEVRLTALGLYNEIGRVA